MQAVSGFSGVYTGLTASYTNPYRSFMNNPG
jgi:hypothetical protein